MPFRRVKFVFKTERIKSPVIYELGHKFEIVTNIRRADIDSENGWVILELEGAVDEIERGLEWVREQGSEVQNLDGDILAG
ncbi:NIL domain-containing protein [Candidatus Lucifugimonas marina]|jgi:ABC-type methionine transport system ATPase subunit|uniref:FeS-binding protein n=1 Tax=Candidatus Lucifugimonas marina TaxID=3038979 RepID=A0AAJ5ZIG8_9CHLR|nr:FeS-binding protein [SAR202 cluster bacterium JH702]MDG0868768.1 FeS-binding protein [SAR202 cluster bacterium JH639]WFG35400.1 FeS-binding protein [SAR202 cluster bacterium JH545]WFG39347.1 FeS-binding protein [SAR202 cluster bacterium JH1073]